MRRRAGERLLCREGYILVDTNHNQATPTKPISTKSNADRTLRDAVRLALIKKKEKQPVSADQREVLTALFAIED